MRNPDEHVERADHSSRLAPLRPLRRGVQSQGGRILRAQRELIAEWENLNAG